MTTPAVELRFHPTDLDHTTLREAFKEAAKPSQAIEAALLAARIQVITAAKAEVGKMTGEMTTAKLIGVADAAWQLYMPKFVRALGPVFADQYIRTMRATGAGEIPMSMVYAMADQHVERIGTYFHESSRDALVNGFNTFVNRRMTERVAADRVLDAYGLTARGMAGYAARATDKAATATPLKLKQRVLDYIGTSFRRRSKIFATQEEHNISQQAEQIAWMWMQDKGQLTPAAEKVWITARDERVCGQCGPMHNVRALLTERFTLPNQTKVYVPGVHPNCRCTVKLLDHPWKVETSKGLLSKADWNPKEHPRGGDPENPGRFSAKARTRRPEPRPVLEEEVDTTGLDRFLRQAQRTAAMEAAIASATEEPVEQKIDITPARMRITPAKMDIKPATLIPEPKMNVAAATESKMDIAPAGSKLDIAVPQQQKLRVHNDTAQMLIAYDEEAKKEAVKRPQPTPYQVKATVHLPHPVYTQVSAWDLDPNGYIELTGDEEFQPIDRDRAHQIADEDFNQGLWDVQESVMNNEENRITQELDDGTTLIGVVDEDYVHDVIDWAAYQGANGDPDQRGDAQNIPVTWYHEGDYPGDLGPMSHATHESMSSIAEEWGMDDPDRFKIHVLMLDEGHDSDLGETVMLNAETRHGMENWTATGRYRVVPDNRMQLGYSVPIQFYRLEPVVDPEERTPPGWLPDLPE